MRTAEFSNDPAMRPARERMVERQIARRGIRDPRVLVAMRHVPREAFVAGELREFAYEDSPLPIEAGQTISQPYIVARMIEAARIEPGERVLEVGAGSGYAAAVLGQLAAEVYAIERHPELAALARWRLAAIGANNIEVRTGDGSRGWLEAAPFDAILVAAGGPEVPDILREQLEIGGRLVMPVGDMESQRLLRITRLDADRFETDDLGAVRFVPLIGEGGWHEDEVSGHAPRRAPARTRHAEARPRPESLLELIRRAAEPLPDFDDPAFGALFDRFADAKVVLLGEASHGTSEFYRARAAITKRLIEKHGFTSVAVEADWPDAATIDRYVRHGEPRDDAAPAFRRFPTWMWRNTDVEAFVGWLRAHNADLPAGRRAGFYGLDLYSLGDSMRAVIDYLDTVDHKAAQIARERYGCLTPWQKDPAAYGRMALSDEYKSCEKAVVAMLRDLLGKRLDYVAHDGERFFDAAQNARLVADAERYYRFMYYGSAESWNLRDRHMFETLEHVLQSKGKGAKAVVWAHNSHIGDARHTEMGSVRDELNIGQLCRERFGSDAALIGFGTDRGTVAAASDWDGPMEVKKVLPARADSYERLVHDADVPRCLLDLREKAHIALHAQLTEPRLERFIGVIYRPDTERWSHYAEASLPQQFDAYVWFDETTAVTPLPTRVLEGIDETWPFGL
jgi:protein-L-isoaspartate(D-aspartate) O-methyltransferase